MIDQLIIELLGQIHPVNNYKQKLDDVIFENEKSSSQDLVSETIYQIRSGCAYFYMGFLEKADESFLHAIANVQARSHECSENELIVGIHTCALIGRFSHTIIAHGINQANNFLVRAENILSTCSLDPTMPLMLFINLLKGYLLSFNGKNADAISIFTEGIKIIKRTEEKPVYVILMNVYLIYLAITRFRIRDLNPALDDLNRAFNIARQINYKYGEAEALRHIGIIYSAQHRLKEAITTLNYSYEIYDKLEHNFGTVRALTSLGINYNTYEPKYAEFCFKKAIDIANQYEFNSELGQLYSKIGDIYMVDGRFDFAEKYYLMDFEHTSQDDSPRRKAHAYKNLGRIRQIQNKLTPAIFDLEQALKLFESIDDKTNASYVALRLCQCLLEKGLIDESKKLEMKARETFKTDDTLENALCDMMLGKIYRMEKKYEAAYHVLQRSLKIQNKYPPSHAKIQTQLELALTYKDQHDYGSYINELKKIIQLARHIRIEDVEDKALELLREADEKEWARMRDIVFLGVAPGSQENKIVNMSVMFADIRNYTTLAQNVDVKELAEFVNDFFGLVSRIVYSNSGIVNKYIGDCVMSFFGLDSEINDNKDDTLKKAVCFAYKAAVEINKSVKLLRHRYIFTYEVEVGIGIASGEVVAGYFGSRERMEFSIIGTTVNLASRIQGFSNKNMALICLDSAKYLSDQPGIVSHPDIKCKGFTQPVQVRGIQYDMVEKGII